MEVVITLGLISFLALAGITVAALLSDATVFGEDSQSLHTLTTTLRHRIRLSDLCSESLGPASGLNQNSIDRATLVTNQQPVAISVSGLHAGAAGNSTVINSGQILPSEKLRINDLRFINARPISADVYIAQIQLSASTLKGRVLKPIVLGSLQIELIGPSATSSIAKCTGSGSQVDLQLCTDMNCEWIATPRPYCRCLQLNSVCPNGEYPIAFNTSGPVCQALGGSCPTGQYLTGLTLGSSPSCASIAP